MRSTMISPRWRPRRGADDAETRRRGGGEGKQLPPPNGGADFTLMTALERTTAMMPNAGFCRAVNTGEPWKTHTRTQWEVGNTMFGAAKIWAAFLVFVDCNIKEVNQQTSVA